MWMSTSESVCDCLNESMWMSFHGEMCSYIYRTYNNINYVICNCSNQLDKILPRINDGPHRSKEVQVHLDLLSPKIQNNISYIIH